MTQEQLKEEIDEIYAKLHAQYEMEYGMHKRPFDTSKSKAALLTAFNNHVDKQCWQAHSNGYSEASADISFALEEKFGIEMSGNSTDIVDQIEEYFHTHIDRSAPEKRNGRSGTWDNTDPVYAWNDAIDEFTANLKGETK